MEKAHFMSAANRNARVTLKRRMATGKDYSRPLLGKHGLQNPERAIAQIPGAPTAQSVAIKRAGLDIEMEYREQQSALREAQDDLPEQDQKEYDRIAKGHPDWNPVQIYEELQRRKDRDAPVTGGIF
jgi:hypothetical protein